jgi:hypothetical protein
MSDANILRRAGIARSFAKELQVVIKLMGADAPTHLNQAVWLYLQSIQEPMRLAKIREGIIG